MKPILYFLIVFAVAIIFGLPETGLSGESKPLIKVKGYPKVTIEVTEPKPLKPIRVVPAQPKIVIKPLTPTHPQAVQLPKSAPYKYQVSGARLRSPKEYINLDEALRNSNEVLRLNLSNQLYEYFPDEVFTLPNLQVLRLTNMKLYEISPEIANLAKLRALTASHNRLEYLPYEIGYLSELRHLDLSNNKFESLPDEIGSLSNLVVLNLSNNNISSLPYGLMELKSLKSLHLDGNPIPNWEIVEIADALPECRIVF
jgi:Leucine-rich repeat (LRR) protein